MYVLCVCCVYVCVCVVLCVCCVCVVTLVRVHFLNSWIEPPLSHLAYAYLFLYHSNSDFNTLEGSFEVRKMDHVSPIRYNTFDTIFLTSEFCSILFNCHVCEHTVSEQLQVTSQGQFCLLSY